MLNIVRDVKGMPWPCFLHQKKLVCVFSDGSVSTQKSDFWVLSENLPKNSLNTKEFFFNFLIPLLDDFFKVFGAVRTQFEKVIKYDKNLVKKPCSNLS